MGGVCLHQQRNELGKRVRKEYENGSREHGGRSSMQDFVPRVDCKTGTLTSVDKDNWILIYEEL